MAKKSISDKKELKTPFVKKEEVLKVVDENGKNIEKFFEVGNELQPFVQEEIDKEILEQLQNSDETPKEPLNIVVEGKIGMNKLNPNQPLKIFENGNVGIGDKPLGNLDINGTFLPLGEPPIENNVEEILQDIIPISVEEFVLENILNSIDSIQTIEKGKLDLVKELILNSQNLEAITLLKSIQTLEHGKVEEIISKL